MIIRWCLCGRQELRGSETLLRIPLYELDRQQTDHLTSLYVPPAVKKDPSSNSVDPLVRVMDELLSPQGCPWDRQQPLLFNDPEQLRDNWLQALQGGESRKAFRLMREYFELVPLEAEMLPKAQETLEQRLLQMYQAKEYRQLSELYKATLKRYPSLQGQLQEQFLALLHWQDSDKAYFQKYESDPGVQSQLQAFVRHLMRDPGGNPGLRALPGRTSPA